MSFSK